MKTKEKFICLLTVLLFLPAVCFGDNFDNVVNSFDRKQLQASCIKFPLLRPTTNEQGAPVFQTLKLNRPVTVDGINFYGFRFEVSGRKAKEDFAWAFISNDNDYGNWYILPQTGDFGNFGFDNYYHESRSHYQGLDELFPLKGNDLVTQRLSGDSLEDDKYYFIWFAYKNRKPAQMSLEFTFADLGTKKAKFSSALDKALGLHHK